MKIFISCCLLIVGSLATYGQKAEYKKFDSDADVPRISVDETKKGYDEKSVVIVDARGAEIYKQEHIKGAINIPLGSPASEFDKLPKNKKIIVYCS